MPANKRTRRAAQTDSSSSSSSAEEDGGEIETAADALAAPPAAAATGRPRRQTHQAKRPRMDVQADGDESASVPADGDSSRGRRQRPAASPRRNSAQAPPPPAEVMMAADGTRDQNDEFCTECRGTGRLLCCDGCPRAFHPVCLDIDENELADDDSAWYCHACSVSRLQQGAAWTTASFAGSPNSAVSASSSSMPPPPQESSSSSSAPAPASVSAVSAPAPESRPTETTGLQDTQPTQSQAAPALPQPDDGDGSSSSSATEEQSANPATLTASTVVQRYFAPSEPQAQQSGSPRSNTVMLAPPPSSRAAPTPTATARRNVRGPRSALTSFLEEQGIRSRVPTDWYRRRNGNEAAAAAAAAATAAAQATATAAMATDAAAADAQVESAASSSSAPSFNAQTATAPDGSLLLAPMLGRSATSALQSMDTANGNGAANGEPSGKDKDKGKGKGKEQAASSTGTPKRKSRKRNGSSSSSSSSDDDDNDWQFRGDSNFVADMARDGHTICIICHCRLTPENMSISRPSWCMQCLQNATTARSTRASASSSPKPAEKQPESALKRGRRVATKINVLGTETAVPPLQQLCVNVICKYIDSVESFGPIAPAHLANIRSVICRHRKLNNSTLTLFLTPELEELKLGDCSGLDADGFGLIAEHCPCLLSLLLDCCGRLTDAALDFLSERCVLLNAIRLNGCFLVKDAAFARLVQSHPRLERLEISVSANLGARFIKTMSDNMAALSASLRHLSLQCCISITDDMLSVLHGLANLKTLSLAQCTVTDRGVIPLLGAIGAHLEELYIDELAIGRETGMMIGSRCHALRCLSAANCAAAMTNETVANIATHAPELKQINLTRCGTLSDLGVGQLVLHCPRLRVLSLNSLNNLTPALFACIAHDRELFDQAIEATRLHHAQLPVRRNPTTGVVIVDPLPEPTAFSAQALTDLQVLDVSWCRSMDDPSFAAIVRSCEQLSRIEIFGCNRLTECIRSLKPASQLRIVGAPFEIAELGGVSEA